MARSSEPMRANGIELDPAAPLQVRAERMLEAFDRDDGARDVLAYALWFADLIDEFLRK